MTGTDRVRAVLRTPRGSRFARPAIIGPDRRQRLLEEMRGNPRVAYRERHGVLPAWMDEPRRHRPKPSAPLPVPRPRTAPDNDPRPGNPRRPPLPRRSRHRKPPRRHLPLLVAHVLTATAGTLVGAAAYHLVAGPP